MRYPVNIFRKGRNFSILLFLSRRDTWFKSMISHIFSALVIYSFCEIGNKVVQLIGSNLQYSHNYSSIHTLSDLLIELINLNSCSFLSGLNRLTEGARNVLQNTFLIILLLLFSDLRSL